MLVVAVEIIVMVLVIIVPDVVAKLVATVRAARFDGTVVRFHGWLTWFYGFLPGWHGCRITQLAGMV